MPSLKAIRKRISSVKNTQKITKAMKMVATAKLRRAQDAVGLRKQFGRTFVLQVGRVTFAAHSQQQRMNTGGIHCMHFCRDVRYVASNGSLTCWRCGR